MTQWTVRGEGWGPVEGNSAVYGAISRTTCLTCSRGTVVSVYVSYKVGCYIYNHYGLCVESKVRSSWFNHYTLL